MGGNADADPRIVPAGIDQRLEDAGEAGRVVQKAPLPRAGRLTTEAPEAIEDRKQRHADAAALGCETGDTLRLSTRRASAEVTVEVSDMMAPGHVSLPNGTGIDYGDPNGGVQRRGLAPNEFTDASSRDFLAGTPWHKHVPARLEKPS